MHLDAAIRVAGLGKRYRIGATVDFTRTLREALMDLPGRLAPAAARPRNQSGAPGDLETPCETFWALRDVTFDVPFGEVLGVIGRNGAGKSTLLKILARITSPTTGRVEMAGRLSSLLEVGTGFHLELTGRENIYLNGALLGMTRAEIDRKFDEMVDFSGVRMFLDTPVKRYSSGQRVRLAFAVAAHLEPEILLIDEVLAVGDAQFQSRCLGKMNEVARSGRTVLFVSHDMAAVSALCSQCLFLKDGRVERLGPTDEVIAAYLEDCQLAQQTDLSQRRDRKGDGAVVLTAVRFLDGRTRQPVSVALTGQDLVIEISYETRAPQPFRLDNLLVRLNLFNALGQFVTVMNSHVASGAFFSGPLPPRGSARTFWRLRQGPETVMLVRYSRERLENAWYARQGRFLHRLGVPVPRIVLDWPERALIVIEDAGHTSLQDLSPGLSEQRLRALYEDVLQHIAPLHRRGAQVAARTRLPLSPPFSPRLYRWEHALFCDEFLRRHVAGDPRRLRAIRQELSRLIPPLAAAPCVLLHRDLQSSNVLIRQRHPVFIDFQGMRLGPLVYDLASLLCDPYVELPAALVESLLQQCCARWPAAHCSSHLFWNAAVQRLAQALGAYGRLGANPATAGFQRHIPAGVRSMLRALRQLGGFPILTATLESMPLLAASGAAPCAS